MKPSHLAFGFLCAALAVLFFHQATITYFNGMGWVPGPAYRQTPIAPWGVPVLWNQCFWGGMWGILFAILLPFRPARLPFVLFAMLFCVTLPILGAWVLVPLIKGTPMFAGGNTTAMARQIGIYAVWGFGLAVFWRGLPLLFPRAPAGTLPHG